MIPCKYSHFYSEHGVLAVDLVVISSLFVLNLGIYNIDYWMGLAYENGPLSNLECLAVGCSRRTE